MKGLYILWPDFEVIDRAIAAGIDTLLVTFHDLPADPPSGYYDSWETSVSVLERYKNSGVRLIVVPLWSRVWTPIPEDQRFMQGGRRLAFTPCPTSVEYMESRINPVKKLIADGLAHGIAWDLEEYNGAPGTDAIKYWSEKDRCECPRCEGMSWKDQLKLHSNLYRAAMRDIADDGNLVMEDWWQLQRYAYPSTIYTEQTYTARGFFPYYWEYLCTAIKKVWNRRCHGIESKIIAGCFMEAFASTDEYLKHLEKFLHSGLYDGYWIYSQRMLSRNSRMTPKEIESLRRDFGYYADQFIDDADWNFFAKLKTINGG